MNFRFEKGMNEIKDENIHFNKNIFKKESPLDDSLDVKKRTSLKKRKIFKE